LIIRFSLSEKYSLKNNFILIFLYFKKLNILYSFPGEYSPKSLEIEIISDYNDLLDIVKKEGLYFYILLNYSILM
jgi:hypothetical protein